MEFNFCEKYKLSSKRIIFFLVLLSILTLNHVLYKDAFNNSDNNSPKFTRPLIKPIAIGVKINKSVLSEEDTPLNTKSKNVLETMIDAFSQTFLQR